MTTSETSDSQNTLSKELIVQNKMGIHARPAAMIVRIANTYPGEIWVEKDDEQINGKSIMGLMMLAASIGTEISVEATGAQAGPALDALEQLIADKFGEGV